MLRSLSESRWGMTPNLAAGPFNWRSLGVAAFWACVVALALTKLFPHVDAERAGAFTTMGKVEKDVVSGFKAAGTSESLAVLTVVGLAAVIIFHRDRFWPAFALCLTVWIVLVVLAAPTRRAEYEAVVRAWRELLRS